MELEYLCSLANQWKKEIRIGQLDQRDAWENLTTRVLKILEYPLLLTTFTNKEIYSTTAF